jgi:hypothetical protein
MNYKDDLTNLDFCVSHIDVNMLPKNKKNVSRALVQKSLLWPQGYTIKIVFLNDPPVKPFYDLFTDDEEYFYQTPFEILEDMEKKTPDGSKMDPLELKFRNLKEKPGGLKKQVPQAIITIIKERFEPFLNLNFEFIDRKYKNSADISIEFQRKKGNASSIGIMCKKDVKENRPSIIFSWFSVQTVMHEFGHALGMLHEHQNPRGSSIPWKRENVIEWARKTQGWDVKKTERNILNYYALSDTNGTNFDPLSIMKYSYPAELTINNKTVYRCLRLSINDIKFLATVYPPTEDQLLEGTNQITTYINIFLDGVFPVKSLPPPVNFDGKLSPTIFFSWIYPDYEKPTKPPSTPTPTYIPSYENFTYSYKNKKIENVDLKYCNIPQNKFMSKYIGLCHMR